MINDTLNQTVIVINNTIVVGNAKGIDWATITVQFIPVLAYLAIFILIFMLPHISSSKSLSLKKLSKITKKNIVLIKHTDAGLFSMGMIDQTCLRKISHIMNKMKGEDFDLILHTPGGDIFSTLAISRLINQYPGKIRAIIPLYSMSGGSLLALSCKEILMTKNASLGPIDPQISSFFKFGSARAWEHIVKFKGKKADDQSVSFAMMGKQYTRSIKAHLMKVVDYNLNEKQKEKLVTFLTDGKVEHAYTLTPIDLNTFGLNIQVIDNEKFLRLLSKLIASSGKEGVKYYKMSKREKKRYGIDGRSP